MCFTEFIGYTCGHQSSEVLRACPLTTQLHTNPVCGNHGRRPILAPCMCPGCQRILHGRCVLTTEWEHHWMHERGVCGCPVVFPDLIQPRIITPFQAHAQPTQPFYQTRMESEANNAVTVAMARPHNYNKVKVVTSEKPVADTSGSSRKKKKKSPGKNSSSSQESSHASHQHEMGEVVSDRAVQSQQGGTRPVGMQQDAKPGENKPKEVSAKIHSLYGAEWVEEHRQLHKSGSCKCAGDFSYYKTPKTYGFTEVSFQAYYDQEQAVRMQLGSQYQTHKPVYPAWQPGLGNIGDDGSAQAGAWPMAQSQIGTLPNFGQPVRSTGAIWQVDLTKSTNPLYNYACTEGARMDGKAGSTLDLQGIDYIKPEDAPLPLVGLPIGAGPESPNYFEHMGSFDHCALNPHKKNAADEAINKAEQQTDPQEVANVVATLLKEAKDSPASKLFRLYHKKSVST